MMERDELRDAFSPLIDGELTGEEKEHVQREIAADEIISNELDEWACIDSLFHSLPKKNAPASLEAMIFEVLRPAPPIRFARRRQPKPLWPIVLSAAMFALVIGGTLLQFGYLKSPRPDVAALKTEASLVVGEALQEPDSPGHESTMKQHAQKATSPSPALSVSDAYDINGDGLAVGGTFFSTGEAGAADALDHKQELHAEPEAAARDLPSASPPAASTLDTTSPEETVSANSVNRDRQVEQRKEAPVSPFLEEGQPAPQPETRTLGQHIFEWHDNQWIESGYAGEETFKLLRNAQHFERVILNHPELEPITHWQGTVIFKLESQWYRID